MSSDDEFDWQSGAATTPQVIDAPDPDPVDQFGYGNNNTFGASKPLWRLGDVNNGANGGATVPE